MKIDNLKDLKKVLELCRAQGVDTIKVDGIEIVLGQAPVAYSQPRNTAQPTEQEYNLGAIDENIRIPLATQVNAAAEELTEEQILFGSSDPSVWEKQQ